MYQLRTTKNKYYDISNLPKNIIMQVGDKVKHVNMGEHIFTIKKIHENTIATIKRPIDLITKLNPNTKSCDKVNDIYICKIENLIKI